MHRPSPRRRPRHGFPPFLEHSAHHLTPRTNSQSGRLPGYIYFPLRFWAPLRSAPSAVRPALLLSASPTLDPSPPPSEVARGPHHRQDGGPQVSVILAVPPFTSRVCSPLMWISMFLLSQLPTRPSPSHHPLHAQDPNPCDQIPFCSRAPLGARSCCLVLPHVPWGSAEALRRTILYRGDTRGGATSHGVAPEDVFIKDLDCLLELTCKAHHSLLRRGKLMGIACFRAHFLAVPASGFTPRRLRRQVNNSPFRAISVAGPRAPRRPRSTHRGKPHTRAGAAAPRRRSSGLNTGAHKRLRQAEHQQSPKPHASSPPEGGAWIANRISKQE